MKGPKTAGDQCEVHAPTPALFEKHYQLFEHCRFNQTTIRFDAHAHTVHIVVDDKEIRIRARVGMTVASGIPRCLITVEYRHLAHWAKSAV